MQAMKYYQVGAIEYDIFHFAAKSEEIPAPLTRLGGAAADFFAGAKGPELARDAKQRYFGDPRWRKFLWGAQAPPFLPIQTILILIRAISTGGVFTLVSRYTFVDGIQN